MLTELQLRNFRCFDSLRVELAPGFNFFIGGNGQGKTSILEGACVLLRLQSQRSSTLGPVVQFGRNWFAASGRVDSHRLDFRYSPLRRRLLFDDVEQRRADEYLRVGRVVSFANTDIDLVRGGSEMRRRYLDFLGAQIEAIYRPTLRAYERALRSRNALLKSSRPRPRELAAFDEQLLQHGEKLGAMRASMIERLAPFAGAAHRGISGNNEALAVRFLPGNGPDFAADLSASTVHEARARQTVVGPHRDDLELLVQGKAANQFASEGQQRTVALALKIAQARVFAAEDGTSPLLLIDDIFGELDPDRRNALLKNLPSDAQKLVTATAIDWHEKKLSGPMFELSGGRLVAVMNR